MLFLPILFCSRSAAERCQFLGASFPCSSLTCLSQSRCTVFCLDRFESGTVGWPPAISELDIRLLLPCEDRLYESGVCQTGDNPFWWPQSLELEESQGVRPGPFAWLVRVVWLGGRLQGETYRSGGESTWGGQRRRGERG